MPYNYKTELERYRKYYQSLEPLMKKSNTQNYTAVIFSFLVISLFGLYAIRPTIQTILTLKREIQDKTDISKKMEDKITALIEAQAAYSQIEQSLPLIDEALPDTPDAIPLVIQIRNLGRISGVTLTTVQMPTVPLYREATPSAKSKTVPVSGKQQNLKFSITLVGPYTAVQAFLTGLQDLRRIVTIDDMTVTPDKTSQLSASDSATAEGQQLMLTLNLVTYYLVK